MSAGIYDLLDQWMGLGLAFKDRNWFGKVSEKEWQQLLDLYVEARSFDATEELTLGALVGDRPGELHIHVPRTEVQPGATRLENFAGLDLPSVMRSLLYGHGVLLESHLMHFIAIENYRCAVRELELLARMRELADVGALRWVESPYLVIGRAPGRHGRVESLPTRWSRGVVPPGIFDPGFSISDLNSFPTRNEVLQMGTLLGHLRMLAPLGSTSLYAPPEDAGRLLAVWLRNVLSRGFAQSSRTEAEVQVFARLLTRWPQVHDATLPSFTGPDVQTLFQLQVDDQLLHLDDVVTLRRDSSQFADWRSALQRALSEVGKLSAFDVSPAERNSTANATVRDALGSTRSALTNEMRRLSTPRATKVMVLSTMGSGFGTAAAGGSGLEAVAGTIGAAVTSAVLDLRSNYRRARVLKSELAHFACFI